MHFLKTLRLNNNGITQLPVSMLFGLRALEVLELNKNKFTHFFDNCFDPNQIVFEVLNYLSLNGNQLT